MQVRLLPLRNKIVELIIVKLVHSIINMLVKLVTCSLFKVYKLVLLQNLFDLNPPGGHGSQQNISTNYQPPRIPIRLPTHWYLYGQGRRLPCKHPAACSRFFLHLLSSYVAQ